jgi:hypothetical protein
VGNPPIWHTHSDGWLSNRCHLEVTRRLRQDAAVQGGTSREQNIGLDQKDALHVCTCAHPDMARDLPEDILCKCAARQDDIHVCGLYQVPRYLNDEDVGGAATEGDVRADADARVEGVDAGRQWSVFTAEVSAEEAATEIDPLGISINAARGVSVRGLHGADRGGQTRRSGCSVVRREGLAHDLGGCRKLPTRVQGEAEAGHGARGDGRDGYVASDDGGGYGGDAALCEDHVIASSLEADRGFRFNLGIYTSRWLRTRRRAGCAT